MKITLEMELTVEQVRKLERLAHRRHVKDDWKEGIFQVIDEAEKRSEEANQADILSSLCR